jgi:pimeloyl-ACP methyl ester carboxylesterase
MAASGRDDSVVLSDGRVMEYWDGGDPRGRPMIMQPGTPETRLMATWGHDAAVSAGVRLLSVNRPGYGRSTSIQEPSLLRVGLDTAAMAEQLGLDAYAVFGLSGGGPFAVANAVADPGHVRALGIIGGTGPWRLLDGPSKDPDGYACLAMADAGDLAGAWDCMRRDVDRAYGRLVELDDAARVDGMLTDISDGSQLLDDNRYRSLWADNIRVVLQNVEGSTFDNLAWGVHWDVDPRDVAAPTLLWYGELDTPCPPAHGRWYADRIADADLVILPGEGHVDVIDRHWPDVLTRLLALWDAPDETNG